jgi:hypothetical protein
MPKFCGNCGAEVKKGYKFCLSCGKEINAITAKSTTQPQTIQTQPSQTQPTPPPVVPQLGYAPTPPKKTNTKLLLGIIIALIAIVIVIVVVIIFVDGGGGILEGSDSDFIGTWETNIGDFWTYQWIFNADKTLEYGLQGYTAEVGTWEVVNGKLHFKITVIGSDLSSQDYDYEFSNGGNTLELEINGVTMFTMTKV